MSLPVYPARPTVAVALLALVLLLMSPPAEALSVEVAPRSSFCVRETVSSQRNTFFSVEVIGAQRSEVRVTLREEKSEGSRAQGMVLRVWESVVSEKFTIPPKSHGSGKKPGVVSACFENKSLLARRRVSFHFAHALVDDSADDLSVVTNPLDRGITEAVNTVSELQGQQQQLRARQRAHRETVESANTMMYVWMASLLLILMLSASGQMFLLKRFVEKRGRH